MVEQSKEISRENVQESKSVALDPAQQINEGIV